MKALSRVVILVALPWAVVAGPDLEKARQAFDELEFDQALEAVEAALAAPDAGPEELLDAYRLQGLCLSGLGKIDASVMAFRKLLSIQPDQKISADTSPKLAGPYYQAVAISREIKPITLVHDASGPRAGPPDRKLSVVLEADPLRLVKGLRLQHRVGPGAYVAAQPVQVAEPGRIELSLPPAKAGQQIEYYLEALTQTGGVLVRLGDPTSPFRAAAEALAAADPPVGGAKDRPGQDPLRDDEPEAAAMAWYRTWWFWTTVGVVVVGTSVGLGVGLGTGGGGDGSMDYTIRVQ